MKAFYQKHIRRFLVDLLCRRLKSRHIDGRGIFTPPADDRLLDGLIRAVPLDVLTFSIGEFDCRDRSDVAAWIGQRMLARSWVRGLLPLARLLSKHGRREELQAIIDGFPARPLAERIQSLTRIRRLLEYLKTQDESFEAEILALKAAMVEGEAPADKRLAALIDNRWLEDAGRLVAAGGVSPAAAATYHRQLEIIQRRLGAWGVLVELANRNFRASAPPAGYEAWYQGSARPVGEISGPVVEFLLPPYFYSATTTDETVHLRICGFLVRVLDDLAAKGVAIVPRQQFRLNDAQPTGHWPAISYHTTGARDDWWHLKDAAFSGYFRFDKRGYSGWSELTGLAALPDEALAVPMEEVEGCWSSLYQRFVDGRISKYGQGAATVPLPSEPFVFFPLQVLDDTVAALADIPMLTAIESLAEALPRLGYKLVLKRHPKCGRPEVDRLLRQMAGNPDVTIYDGPIHDVLAVAAAVVTVNSGVGFEALLQGRKVITIGASEYALATRRARTIDQLIPAIQAAPVPMDQVKRFVWFYLQGCVAAEDAATLSAMLDRTILRSRLP